MKSRLNFHPAGALAGLLLLGAIALCGLVIQAGAANASPQVIEPAELVKLLQAPKSRRPIILQVGFRVLYEQAHIPGSEYLGAASEAAGRQQLHQRVQGLPRNSFIVLYCGCCPWSHCPNVQPAYKELQVMDFRKVKILYIAHNFGADWVDKGYPVSKGK